jgi:hypothetical protein
MSSRPVKSEDEKAQCPSRGRRVKDAYGVACDRFATLDTAATARGMEAIEEDGGGPGRGRQPRPGRGSPGH